MRRESPQPSKRPSVTSRASQESFTTSDNESGGEKPVREKLRDTSIAAPNKDEEAPTSGSDASRLRRKRSIEDVEGELEDAGSGDSVRHVRKRSRGNTPEDKMETTTEVAEPTHTNGTRGHRSTTPDVECDRMVEEQKAGMASPKNKRTRDQVLQEEEASSGESASAAASVGDKEGTAKTGEERQTKRHRDSGSPQPQAPIELVSKLKSDAHAPKVVL
jgi:hypothetical protein